LDHVGPSLENDINQMEGPDFKIEPHAVGKLTAKLANRNDALYGARFIQIIFGSQQGSMRTCSHYLLHPYSRESRAKLAEKFYCCTSPSLPKERAEWWSKLWQMFPLQVGNALFQSLAKVCLAQWSQDNL
jgi:hypothetical protein